ncbi:hypothetical protein CAPTEDRAFT_214240 [Capitella teleta]|uniref:Uncharacterized protein n=1 Tax=Capitella teleta TaxID=283909 RepID=R7T8G0_CAPTE|nr:hypothetical protein CAPTEDRAFT_214240 [Capitella teleta]|eukprot:ELT87670.1 hypothetical protein CAPTEDRAFT_214240 [Capitella teleta]
MDNTGQTEGSDPRSTTAEIAAMILADRSSESSDTEEENSETLNSTTPSAHDHKSRFTYANSDSSDIEVLLETTNSSDSIEVLESSCIQRQDTVVESRDETSVADTCSDSPTLLSNNSSSCSTDDSKNNSPKIQCRESEDGNQRPDSLVLPKPLQYYERLSKKESFSSVSSRSSSMDALLETPLSMHGTISKDGEMLSFVAEGLTDMIKRCSPMSRSRTGCGAFFAVHTLTMLRFTTFNVMTTGMSAS